MDENLLKDIEAIKDNIEGLMYGVAGMTLQVMAYAFGNSLVMHSPIDTGQYILSHSVNINNRQLKDKGPMPPRAAIKKPSYPRSGGYSNMMSELKVIEGTSFINDIFFSNGTSYATDIEYGKSGKAPRGVYKLAMDSVHPAIETHLRGALLNAGPLGRGEIAGVNVGSGANKPWVKKWSAADKALFKKVPF